MSVDGGCLLVFDEVGRSEMLLNSIELRGYLTMKQAHKSEGILRSQFIDAGSSDMLELSRKMRVSLTFGTTIVLVTIILGLKS